MRPGKKLLFLFASGLGLAAVASFAQASTITVTPSATGPIAGVTYDNLNSGTPGPAVTFSGSAAYVTGSSPYNYAAPMLFNGIGASFGDADGTDASRYIAVEGGGSARFQFSSLQSYLGLLWGSVDSFNTLSFYNGSTLVGSVSGTDVTSNANGDQTASGTLYVNLDSSLPFNAVVASSSANAFEFDDIAYGQPATAVPEPSSLIVFGSGVALLAAVLRYRRKTDRADI